MPSGEKGESTALINRQNRTYQKAGLVLINMRVNYLPA